MVPVCPGRGHRGDGLCVVFDNGRQRRRIEDQLQDREPYQYCQDAKRSLSLQLMDTELVTSKPKRPYRSAEETRKHVLDIATRLFYCEGIHAVGIDGLAAKAGVTTATLYRLFGSKEGLIIAYLRRADQEWFEWFYRTVAEGGLPKLFDELEHRVK